MKRFFLCFIFFLPINLSTNEYKKLAYGFNPTYQPIWVNGKEVLDPLKKRPDFFKNFEKRYEIVKNALSEYDQPLKVLDVGANNGYFCVRLAHELGANCIALDKVQRLADIFEANVSSDKLIALNKLISVKDLKKLANSEKFNVIFLFNIIHGKDDWKDWIEVCESMCDLLIVNTPVPDYTKNNFKATTQVFKYLEEEPAAKLVGEVQGCHYKTKSRIDRIYKIEVKPVTKKSPGINIDSFFYFNGIFPRKNEVNSYIRRYFGEQISIIGKENYQI